MAYFENLRLGNLFGRPRGMGMEGEEPAFNQSNIAGYTVLPPDIPTQVRRPNIPMPMEKETPDISKMPTYYKPDMTEYQRQSLGSLNQYREGTLGLREQELARNLKKDEETQKIARQRADIYDFKAKNPNMRIYAPKGGNVYAINPVTGKRMDLGISSGTLSDIDKIELEQEKAIERIEKTGEVTRETNKVRSEQEIASAWGTPVQAFGRDGKPLDYMLSINAKTGESKKVPLGSDMVTRTTPPGAGNITPSQEGNEQFNKARQILFKNPDYRRYITLGKGGDFTLKMPLFRGDKTVYDKIYQDIYGSSAPTISNTQGAAPLNKGMVTVMSPPSKEFPKGQEGTIPASQLDEALKQGYKRK